MHNLTDLGSHLNAHQFILQESINHLETSLADLPEEVIARGTPLGMAPRSGEKGVASKQTSDLAYTTKRFINRAISELCINNSPLDLRAETTF